MENINIYELIKNNTAISSDYGEIVFKKIIDAFNNKKKVMLNFQNLNIVTSTFLNAAIGQLYDKYNSAFLNTNLKIEKISKEDFELLKKVIERAKEYFKDKNGFINTAKATLENE